MSCHGHTPGAALKLAAARNTLESWEAQAVMLIEAELATAPVGIAASFAAPARVARPKINLISPQRAKHILTGDATGGGHKFGISRLFNGKTKFPWRWSDEKILDAVSEVATSPNSTWTQQTGKPGSLLTKAGDPVKFKVEGVFDGVRIRAIVQGNDIITAFPIP